MIKELLTGGVITTTSLGAFAFPGHGGPHFGGPGPWGWGPGGRHFWPSFAGGVAAGLLGGWCAPRTVVYTTPAVSPVVYTTPAPAVSYVVPTYSAPVSGVIQGPVQAETTVKTVSLPASEKVAPAKKQVTTVYVDTNKVQCVVGDALFDAQGNMVLPNGYKTSRIDDVRTNKAISDINMDTLVSVDTNNTQLIKGKVLVYPNNTREILGDYITYRVNDLKANVR